MSSSVKQKRTLLALILDPKLALAKRGGRKESLVSVPVPSWGRVSCDLRCSHALNDEGN